MLARTPATLRTAALALAAIATAGTALTAPPAGARTVDDHGTSARAALSCRAQVIGVTAERKLVVRDVTNGQVTGQRVGSSALAFDPTALGIYSGDSTDTTTVLKVSAVTTDGVPRLVRATWKNSGTSLSQSSQTFAQTGFKPRLFADSFGYQVYTVNGAGTLQRWYTTKLSSGALVFDHKLSLGSGYGQLSTLQIATRLKVNGVVKDFLYATTATGGLKQIVVPINKPANERVTTLKTSGYKGVSGLSTAYCNSDATFSMIVAVNASADSASWTTVRNVSHATADNTIKRGLVGTGSHWVLHAVM